MTRGFPYTLPWRGGRVAEGTTLLTWQTARSRGFESLPLRHPALLRSFGWQATYRLAMMWYVERARTFRVERKAVLSLHGEPCTGVHLSGRLVRGQKFFKRPIAEIASLHPSSPYADRRWFRPDDHRCCLRHLPAFPHSS